MGGRVEVGEGQVKPKLVKALEKVVCPDSVFVGI